MESFRMSTCGRCQRSLPDGFRVCPFDATPLEGQAQQEGVSPLFAGRYELLRKLGEGGTAHVYKALDVRSSKHVAVKIIEGPAAKTATWAERLLREVDLLKSIRHPNVVEVYDGGR